MTNAFCKQRSSSLPRQQGSYSTPVNPSDENSPQKLSQNLTLTCYLTCHNARHYGATNARARERRRRVRSVRNISMCKSIV